MNTQKLESAVAQGAKLLDDRVPNWREEIDIDKLNMGSCLRCVLGQIYGEYEDGIDALNLDRTKDEDLKHGFDAIGSYGQDIIRESWIAEINKRTQIKETEPCTKPPTS